MSVDWLSESEKKQLVELLEKRGSLAVCAAVAEWWDEFKDGTKEEYERTALSMHSALERSSLIQ